MLNHSEKRMDRTGVLEPKGKCWHNLTSGVLRGCENGGILRRMEDLEEEEKEEGGGWDGMGIVRHVLGMDKYTRPPSPADEISYSNDFSHVFPFISPRCLPGFFLLCAL